MKNSSTGMYPEVDPFDQCSLKVSELHSIAVYRFGNPDGIPVIYLHGGPGSGIRYSSAQTFDPKKYHIIMFDQRGCGQSKPFAELKENTTDFLIEDIEAIREKYKVKKWSVYGGSWGSTLALAYAIKHTKRVSHLVLRGIFLGSRREIDHLYLDGASRFFPENYERFLSPLKESQRSDVFGSYYKRLTSEDKDVRLQAAREWSLWEGSIIKLIPDPLTMKGMEDNTFAEAFARIECHYFINNCFFPCEDYLLKEVHRIKDIPGIIVQGRYDVVCAPREAWKLSKAWPKAELCMIKDAGHSGSEPGIVKALVDYMDRIKK